MEYYLTGKSEPKIGRCVDIARAVGVDITWLATGEGEQHQGVEMQPPAHDVYVYVPLYDSRCSAGQGQWSKRTTSVTQLAFTVSSLEKRGLDYRSLAAIRVDGDSMEGLLSDGDAVMFDHARKVLEGEAIYVIRLDDHLYPKRLQRQLDSSVHVISENKAYRDLVVPKEHLDGLEIVGRVVWSGEWMI